MPQHSISLQNFVFYCAAAAIILYGLVVGSSILMPLVISIIIAYLINALSASFEELPGIGSYIPGWLAFIMSLLTVALILMGLVNLIVANVEQVVAKAPEYQIAFKALIERIQVLLGIDKLPSIAQVLNELDLVGIATSFISPLGALASNTLVIIFYVSFLLLERNSINVKLRALIPDVEREQKVEATLEDIEYKIRKYIWIKTLISFLTAGFSYVVMMVLGIDFAAFWAVLIFVLNFIPYIGSIVAVAFPVMLTLLQFQSFWTFILTLSLLMGVQISVGSVLEPRIMGSSLNLSPLVILLTLALWGSIWGIVGMIICIPILVISMIIFAQFPRTRPIAIIMSQDGDIEDILDGKKAA